MWTWTLRFVNERLLNFQARRDFVWNTVPRHCSAKCNDYDDDDDDDNDDDDDDNNDDDDDDDMASAVTSYTNASYTILWQARVPWPIGRVWSYSSTRVIIIAFSIANGFHTRSYCTNCFGKYTILCFDWRIKFNSSWDAHRGYTHIGYAYNLPISYYIPSFSTFSENNFISLYIFFFYCNVAVM